MEVKEYFIYSIMFIMGIGLVYAQASTGGETTGGVNILTDKNTLNSLSDVEVPSPLNDQVLTFNSATNQWINKNSASGGGGGDFNFTNFQSSFDLNISGYVHNDSTANLTALGVGRNYAGFSTLELEPSGALTSSIFSVAEGGGTYIEGWETSNLVESFSINHDGRIQWGDGSNAVDTNLYRGGANILKTDDRFEVIKSIQTSADLYVQGVNVTQWFYNQTLASLFSSANWTSNGTATTTDLNLDQVLILNSSVSVGLTQFLDDFNVNGSMDLLHVSQHSQDHALEIDLFANGFGDVKALDIFYSTGAIALGQDEEAILVIIDESSATGGDVAGLEVLSTEGSANIFGLFAGALVNPIEQLSGVFEDADSVLVVAVDQTTALSGGGAGNIAVFVSDDDTMTIGSSVKFEEIEFLLDTVSSGAGIAPTFEFSTGGSGFTSFTPTDATNGMRNNGVIVFLDKDIPTWATNGGEFLIRITRTRNNLGTNPIADKVQVAKATEFFWDKNGYLEIFNLTASNELFIGTTAVSPLLYNQTLAGNENWTSNGTATITDSALSQVIIPNGKVGIGTTSPSGALEVHGTNFVTQEIEAEAGDPTINFLITGQERFVIGIDDTDNFFKISEGNNLADNPILTITNAERVGIGTTSPSNLLDIDAGTGFGTMELDGSSGGCFIVRDTDDAGWSKGTLLNGAVTWAIDADGVC